jgi:MATE family multidrug resistance protein
LPLIDDGLALLSYSPEVTNLQAKYLQYRLWTGGAVVGLEALANYYGGIGNTRLPMAAQVLAMTLNVALNVLLINGYWGFPAMGVAGSALASALATLVAFLALFACFFFGVGAPKATERAVLKAGELTRMLRFGLPSGFNWFFEFLAFSFFVNFVVAGLGTTAVAALMSVIQLCSVSFMPAFGISSAGAILVGQAIGAGVLDDVPRIAKLTAKTTTVWQGLVSAMFIAMPTLLLRPFLSNDDAANVAFLAVGARMLRLATLWQVSDALATTLAETLRAAGDTAFTMWTRVVAGWLVFAPGSFITVRYFGGTDVAAVLWLAGYMTLLAGAFYLRFRAGAWRRLDLTGLHGGAPI